MKQWLKKFLGAQTPEVAKVALGVPRSSAGDLTLYQLTAEKGAADGYASLDSVTKIPIAEIPTGTTSATVAIGDDARLSDDRVAAGIRTDTTVVLVDTATAPTAGQVLTATSDTAAEWADPGAGGDILFSAAPNATTSIASTTAVEVVNKSVTLAAGDVVEVEVWGTVLNDSAANRTYTPSMVLTVGVNTLTLTCTDGTTVGFHASNRAYWRLKAWFTVASTSATEGMMESDRTPIAVANSAQSIVATTNRKVWNTTSSNMTGSASIAVRFASNSATATQQFTLYGYQIRQNAQVT